MKNLKIGCYVKSTKGRDKDQVYIVKKILDNKVELVNGYEKKLNKPKVKNVKHILVLNDKLSKIGEKFATDKKVYDEEVFSAIKKFKLE